MKKCPYCAEEIQDEAIKCRFCQSTIPTGGHVSAQGSGLEPKSGLATLRSAMDAADDRAHENNSPSPRGDAFLRKVLYEGVPSWRAYLGIYALITIAAIVVPILANWIARKMEVTTMTRVLAIAIPLALASIAYAIIYFMRRSNMVRVTTTNIETERGFLSKKIDVLELWRCRDVRYMQSFVDRIMGIAHIEIDTTDVTSPKLMLEGLPASRQLFEQIRDSIEIQRQSRNVLGMVQ